MDLMHSIIDYRRHLKRRNYSSHTIMNYMSSIKLFILWLDVPVEDVTYDKISGYIDYLLDKRMHPQSINSNLYRIRGFYDFLHYEKRMPIKNPVRERCGLRLPKPLPKCLRDTDEKKLFSVINKPRDLAMFKIMLRCGLRLEETANLTKDAVDLELQQLIVYNGKGKKDRVGFISDDAKAALTNYLKQRSSSRVKKIFLVEKGTYKGKPISVHGIKKRMEYYAKKIRREGFLPSFKAHHGDPDVECRREPGYHPDALGTQQDYNDRTIWQGSQCKSPAGLLQGHALYHGKTEV